MKKIPTLFKRTFADNRVVSISNQINEQLEGVDLFKLIPTVKYDGSCCAIIDGKFYKRYDAKHGKHVPDDAIRCQDKPDSITGHFPCWIPVTDEPCDKWFRKAYESASNPLPDGTYEAIGQHFNGNKYNMTYDTLVPHGKDVITDLVMDFERIKSYLWLHEIEGIVFWDDTHPVCKIKRTDFGYKW